MEIKLETRPIEQIECDALVIPAFDKEDSPEGTASELTRAADRLTGGWIRDLYQSGEFTGKPAETALLYRASGLKAGRLLLVGAGKKQNFTPVEQRKAAGTAARFFRSRHVRSIALAIEPGDEFMAAAAAEGVILGHYEPDQYKTENKDQGVETVLLAVSSGRDDLEPALRRAQTIAEAQNFTRTLVAEPANRMTPRILAERAGQMAAEQGLEFEVLDQDRMRQLGMGALLGVAMGSAEPPVLIVVRYRPPQGGPDGIHLGLVGKGVTFDTGGISIKPSDGMEKMKYDMAGGAAVIGAMRAIANLKPSIPVTALVPAVENMPGGRAQRPGDIVTTLSGKTVEVLNTDAEGRLILADALTYARRLGCTHLVNAATLTGAIVVALGHVNIGAFTNDQPLLDRVMAAARAAGEKMWPMPLDDDYKELLKSVFADLPNIGGRWGGAISAAMFLKEFADTTPWVHLDIAGTAWLEEPRPFLAKGPSGVPLRTFVNLAMNWQ